MIHPTAVIHPNVKLGEGVWVGPYAVIGTPAELRGGWRGEGEVEVGDRTVIRENVTIQGPARIGADCYLMDGVHVAHDNVIGDGVTIAPKTAFAGHVTVQARATVGIGVVVHQHRVIGEGAMVGMGSVVTHDIPPFRKWYGNPATDHGWNERALEEVSAAVTTFEAWRECFD